MEYETQVCFLVANLQFRCLLMGVCAVRMMLAHSSLVLLC